MISTVHFLFRRPTKKHDLILSTAIRCKLTNQILDSVLAPLLLRPSRTCARVNSNDILTQINTQLLEIAAA